MVRPVGRRGVLGGGAALLAAPAHGAPAHGAPAHGAPALPRVALVVPQGRIDIVLDIVRAPLSAADFLGYVDRHDYDGGAFTRVVRADNDHGAARIDVVQGGIRPGVAALPPVAHESTQSTGLRHLDGTISLPRDRVGTGGGAEFFICVGDQPALDFGGRRNPDGQGFAAFGRVVAGMELVRAIWRMRTGAASPDAYTAGQMLALPVPILSAFRI